MTKKIISVLVAIIILSVSVISFATSTQELSDKISELEQNINDAQGKIGDIKNEVNSVEHELEQLAEEIAAKEDEIEELAEELKNLNNEINELTGKINEQEQKYNEQYDLFCKRLVAQYKMGKVSYLDVLLNSKSLSDFVSKYYIIEKIAEYDNKLLTQIEEQKTALEKAKVELDKKLEVLKEKEAKLKSERINLSNKKAVKNRYVAQLSDEEKELQQQIEAATEEKRQAEAEMRRIAAESGNKGNESGFTYTGGQLNMPCNYTRISSRFGYRGSAATGGVGSSNHKGIDFAAPKGNSIFAAEDGVVIKVSHTCTHNYAKTYRTRCSCGGGFGNYVMVSHGNGLVTLYGHCTDIYVNVGDTVSRGQTIATVGCTGYSTGNHLHFSVLLNGTYVNPAPYLGI